MKKEVKTQRLNYIKMRRNKTPKWTIQTKNDER